ncbi:MAG: metalloregulator ArsR/SmtB family transcription factor [Candidatus Krumholzibacteriia bacterium]
METVAATLKALADPNRLRLVWALMQRREVCACQLTELLGVAGATASRHLAVLVAAGLVEGRRDGRWIHYGLTGTFRRSGLARWLDRQSDDDPRRSDDRRALAAILAEDPTLLCRRQRGDTCCPREAS